jgi:RNA polymerase sigma-70 factor (ECF subfamily)
MTDESKRLEAEDRLIARAIRGDSEAFDALIEPRWPRMYRIGWRITGDREEGQDVAQRACLRLWETMPRFRIGEDLDGWIYRMTVNLAIDALRRRKARPEVTMHVLPEPRSHEPKPDMLILSRELEVALEAVTRDLPARQKAVFMLVRVEGMTPQAAAQALGVAGSTVRNHLFQARAVIAARLRQQYPGLLGELGIDHFENASDSDQDSEES